MPQMPEWEAGLEPGPWADSHLDSANSGPWGSPVPVAAAPLGVLPEEMRAEKAALQRLAMLTGASRSTGLPSQSYHVKIAFQALVTSPHSHHLLHWSVLHFPKHTSHIFPASMPLHSFSNLLKMPFSTWQNPTAQEEIGYQVTYTVHFFFVCFGFFGCCCLLLCVCVCVCGKGR